MEVRVWPRAVCPWLCPVLWVCLLKAALPPCPGSGAHSSWFLRQRPGDGTGGSWGHLEGSLERAPGWAGSPDFEQGQVCGWDRWLFGDWGLTCGCGPWTVEKRCEQGASGGFSPPCPQPPSLRAEGSAHLSLSPILCPAEHGLSGGAGGGYPWPLPGPSLGGCKYFISTISASGNCCF